MTVNSELNNITARFSRILCYGIIWDIQGPSAASHFNTRKIKIRPSFASRNGEKPQTLRCHGMSFLLDALSQKFSVVRQPVRNNMWKILCSERRKMLIKSLRNYRNVSFHNYLQIRTCIMIFLCQRTIIRAIL